MAERDLNDLEARGRENVNRRGAPRARKTVVVLNRRAEPPRMKTVVVLSVAGAGNRLVSSVLDDLGVPGGRNVATIEDEAALRLAVESRDVEGVKRIVAARDAAHDVWAWTRPPAIEHAPGWHGCLRNPYVVAIFRDPLAIALRNPMTMPSDVLPAMENAQRYLQQLLNFVRQHRGPVLLSSYEMMQAAPEGFLRTLHRFLGLEGAVPASAATRLADRAGSEIADHPAGLKSRGRLVLADEHGCSGWAYHVNRPQRAAIVEISVNGRVVQSVEASLLRPGLKKSGKHPTGLCGFKLEWPTAAAARPGDRVEARVKGDATPLRGSPLIVGTAGRVD